MTLHNAMTTDALVARVRALANATPNPGEGSLGHLRDDFAWQLEEDLRTGAYSDAIIRHDAQEAICVWENASLASPCAPASTDT